MTKTGQDEGTYKAKEKHMCDSEMRYGRTHTQTERERESK
jgi:hypothetical protein